MKRNVVDYAAMVLTFVGALNWGLIGFFNFNLVSKILGAGTKGETIIYDIVGIAAVYLIIRMVLCGKKCCDKK